MSNTKEIPQAFPSISNNGYKEGMTLLDYFAAVSLNGLLSYSWYCHQRGNFIENGNDKTRAEHAYKQAEAMMKEREKYLGSNDAVK